MQEILAQFLSHVRQVACAQAGQEGQLLLQHDSHHAAGSRYTVIMKVQSCDWAQNGVSSRRIDDFLAAVLLVCRCGTLGLT